MPDDKTLTIVSGGQTGVDQGGLAAALESGIECGGWCPEGRRSEDGPIPASYPVVELSGAGYTERTRRNVQDSDGTVVVFRGELEGGTRMTTVFCEEEAKPYLLIDVQELDERDAIDALAQFVADNDIAVLNVAGPRASKWPGAFDYTRDLISAFLAVARG